MAEPASPKYAVNPQTGQVMRNDGTGWAKVKTAKNQQGEILINENGAWTPLPARAPAAPSGYAAPPKMSIAQAADVTGAQGKEFGFADEASALKRSFGIPKGVDKLLDANPFNRFVNMGLGAGVAISDAAGVKMSNNYTKAKDVEDAQLAQARADRPVTSFVSEFVQALPYPGGTLRMGAPILRETAKMFGIGALQGGVYGFGTGEGEGRIENAGAGAAVGGALGAATPSVAAAALPVVRGTRSAIASLTDNIVEMFGGTGTAAENYARQVAEAAVRRSMERSGMTPERILETLQRYGNKEAVLAEVLGQDAINALSSLTRRPGSTPQRAQDVIAERMGGFQERAADDLRQTTGLTDAQIRGEFGPELQARREAAAPVYDELFEQQGNVASERLAALSGTNTLGPMIRRAQAAASDLAIARGRDPQAVTPLEVLDLAKRELDDEIATATRNQQNAEVMRLQSLQAALLRELDDLTGGQYAAAREVGGEAPRLQEARAQGERALLPGTTRATVAEQAAALNPQDRSAFASGAVSRMDEQIANNQLDPRRFRNPAMQEKLGAALGPEAGQDLSQRMVAEAELRDLAGRWGPRSGSITGTVLESGPNEALDSGIQFATAMARGDRIGLVTQAISWMRRRGYNQQQIDAMGELLLSNPREGLRRLGVQLPTPGAPGAAGAAGAAAGGTPPPQGTPPPSGGTPPANALAPTPPPAGGTQPANALAPKGPGKIGTRIADGAAVATLGLQGGTAEADTGETSTELKTSPELKTANERVTGIEAQINKLDNETIPTLEEQIRLLQDYRADPKEKQRILIARGHKLGEYGPNRDGVDGVITPGSYSANAIVSEVAKIEADIARRRQEREGYKSDLATARDEVDKIKVSEAEQGGKPATPLRDKVLEAASYGAGIYLAHRFRNAGLRGAQKDATAIESKANALLSRRPPVPPVPDKTALGSIPLVGQPIEKALFPNKVARNTSATNAAARAARAAEPRLSGDDVPPISPDPTSPDGLPTRVANLNKYYTDGGAEQRLPFEDLGDGQFASRTDVMPDHRLYGPKGPIGRFMEPVTSRFRTGDLAVTAGGALDYTVMSGMVEQTRADIKTAEEELKVARAKNDSIGIARAKKDIEKLETIESVQVAFQRLGLGMMGFGVLGGMHGKYARPQPRHEAAIRERNLINQAISPAPPGGPQVARPVPPPPAPPPPPNALAAPVAPSPSPTKKPRAPSKPKPKPPAVIGPSGRTKKPANDNN